MHNFIAANSPLINDAYVDTRMGQRHGAHKPCRASADNENIHIAFLRERDGHVGSAWIRCFDLQSADAILYTLGAVTMQVPS